MVHCIPYQFITLELSLQTQVYFKSSLLSTQKVIIPVLPKTLKYTVYLKPRQSKTYQAD